MLPYIRILLADDDPEDRMIMEDTFRQIELSDVIHFVENGENILAYLDAIAETDTLPSLIVLDLNMPRMNGTQTLKMLKANGRYKDIPVIIFSTSINTIEMNECIRTGASSYVVKPVTYTECVHTARSFYKFSQDGDVSVFA